MSRKNWNDPAGKNDDSYNIGVTTLATLDKITRGNLVETGIENKKIYDIKSTELDVGITVHAEDGNYVDVNKNKKQIEHGE